MRVILKTQAKVFVQEAVEEILRLSTPDGKAAHCELNW
jgi:hypothetical protein